MRSTGCLDTAEPLNQVGKDTVTTLISAVSRCSSRAADRPQQAAHNTDMLLLRVFRSAQAVHWCSGLSTGVESPWMLWWDWKWQMYLIATERESVLRAADKADIHFWDHVRVVRKEQREGPQGTNRPSDPLPTPAYGTTMFHKSLWKSWKHKGRAGKVGWPTIYTSYWRKRAALNTKQPTWCTLILSSMWSCVFFVFFFYWMNMPEFKLQPELLSAPQDLPRSCRRLTMVTEERIMDWKIIITKK